MVGDPHIALRMEAFSVGLAAQLEDPGPARVESLMARAARLLAPDDPLAAPIRIFGAGYPHVRHRPAARAELGRELTRWVEIVNRPDVPGSDRRDIYG